jgi:5-methyltetrahydrofolate--homocysteine methyltransferase
LPETADGRIVYRETPQQRGELTQLLLDEKVNIIGGCCGTGPGHTRAIKDTVDLHK